MPPAGGEKVIHVDTSRVSTGLLSGSSLQDTESAVLRPSRHEQIKDIRFAASICTSKIRKLFHEYFQLNSFIEEAFDGCAESEFKLPPRVLELSAELSTNLRARDFLHMQLSRLFDTGGPGSLAESTAGSTSPDPVRSLEPDSNAWLMPIAQAA